MVYANIVVLLALLEFLAFAVLVGKARGTFGVAAPATSGNEMFERYYRVQMNTLELLVMFVPALLLAATYWNGLYSALIGVVYLIGRVIYFRAYVAAPKTRTLGYTLSIVPVAFLITAALIGAVVRLFAATV